MIYIAFYNGEPASHIDLLALLRVTGNETQKDYLALSKKKMRVDPGHKLVVIHVPGLETSRWERVI